MKLNVDKMIIIKGIVHYSVNVVRQVTLLPAVDRSVHISSLEKQTRVMLQKTDDWRKVKGDCSFETHNLLHTKVYKCCQSKAQRFGTVSQLLSETV